MTLSRRHLSITIKDRKIWVKDLGSANGSFLKIKNSVPLELDDQFRIGQQLFKFNLKKDAARRTIVFNTELKEARSLKSEVQSPKSEVRSQKIEEAKPEAAKLEGMFVVFKNLGKSCSFKAGQTICEIAENNGLKLKADCRIGSCGLDPIRIVAGMENMSPVGDEEQGTLEDINKLEPGKYRLACVAKPKGPVVVEILEQK
jgi:ferredoxin